MAGYLTPEWIDVRRRVLVAAGGDAVVGPGAGATAGDGGNDGDADGAPVGRTARVRRVVTGAPGGDVAYDDLVVGGRVVGSEPVGGGTMVTADLVLTSTYAVAVAIERGDVSPAVAYMQGRLKAEGDMGTLYAVLAAAGDDGGPLAERLRAETEF
ncbi:MAG TPA: hypothetical protein VK306_00225 [Acidimicrobiales bacterium]|nr:hypothetical protein [Acidimicrobiales bacterium]